MTVTYSGRTDQAAEVQLFLGINSKSSIVAGKDGEAIDIDNWDIDRSGAITRRRGFQVVYQALNDVHHLDTFFKLDGTQVFVGVAGYKLYEATDPAGAWTDRGGNFTQGDYTYIGTDMNGQFVLCNGVDAPVVFIPGENVKTLKDASLVPPPTNLTVEATLGAGVYYKYAVTSTTPRGESIISTPAEAFNGPTVLDDTHFNTLFWVPQSGAYSQKVYRWNGSIGKYELLATLVGTATGYVDNGGDTPEPTENPPTTSGSYNTPADWDENGQPEGVYVISRGKNQRMMAWRKSFVWVSALNNIYDWYTSQDAFGFWNLGGFDNNITAVTTLYDYTVIFSNTNSFVYTGSSYADWSLSKVMNTGCPSYYAIVYVGDVGYIWSQFGPTTIERILSGQDVSTLNLSQNISNLVYERTNVTEWHKVRAWHDIREQRVCFAVPGLNQTRNTMVLAFNYQTKGWTKFAAWDIENVVMDPVKQVNYASLNGNRIVLLHVGFTDAGTAIDNSFLTIFHDVRTWNRKRVCWVDVMMDAKLPYQLDVSLVRDFYDTTTPMETFHLAFDGTAVATTDGETIVQRNELVNIHRFPTMGYGQYYALLFRDVGNITPYSPTPDVAPARVLGYRMDFRVHGVR